MGLRFSSSHTDVHHGSRLPSQDEDTFDNEQGEGEARVEHVKMHVRHCLNSSYHP